MTLINDINSAQSVIKLPFANKPLLIRTPISLVDAYNPNRLQLWIYDPTNYLTQDNNDWVYLRLFPQYEPADELIAEGKYSHTFNSSAVANLSAIRSGFNATVRQSSKVIFDLIFQLAYISATTSFSRHSPIKIIDFIRPEPNKTVIQSNSESGTVRNGRIDITQYPTFIKGFDGQEYCKNGWSFKFSQVDLKYI